MRTSEDASRSGLYASECCGAELVFYKGDTLWRCPECHHLCDWELVESALTPDEIDSVPVTESTVASIA